MKKIILFCLFVIAVSNIKAQIKKDTITKEIVVLMEYDRTKVDPTCDRCKIFYKLLDDATIEDIKNITQITAHKARVKISPKVMNDNIRYTDSLFMKQRLDSLIISKPEYKEIE